MGAQLRVQAADIRPIAHAIPEGSEQFPKIGASEIGASAQLGEGIEGGADGVEVDIGGLVEIEALGEVSVDAEEFGGGAGEGGGGGEGLGFEGGEEGLEPFEGGGVFADPDELDAAEAARRVGPRAQVPDVFEDAGPGRDADAGADEDGDVVVEDVFGRRAVRPVDADRWHRLPVGERDLVHAHRVEGVVVFGLGGAGAHGVAEGAGPVADLADVDGDVGVEGAGGDGEGVPLRGGDAGHVDEEPLPGFVVHAGFAELDL